MTNSAELTGPSFCRRAGITLGLLAAVYGVLFFLQRTFPYVGEGGDVVVLEKIRHAETQPIFPSDADRRLVIFGNSKVLSGFVPDTFDSLSGGRIASYNMGLPEARQVVPYLESLIKAGNIPTDVLITILWTSPPEKNPLVLIDQDQELVKRLVPFRYLIRDSAIFLRRSVYRGGFSALYAETRRASQQVLTDRGYYFITGQSRYKNEQLPPDFQLKSDTPDTQFTRIAEQEGSAYERLTELLEEHSIQAYIAPTYYRIPENAPRPSVEPELRAAFAEHPSITVFDGPAYFSYSNDQFSDRLHLNRDGAQRYTRDLWELFEPHFVP